MSGLLNCGKGAHVIAKQTSPKMIDDRNRAVTGAHKAAHLVLNL